MTNSYIREKAGGLRGLQNSLGAMGPVVRKPINANPGLNSNRGFNFLHPNHLHNHNLRINEKKSPIYNPKAKIS